MSFTKDKWVKTMLDYLVIQEDSCNIWKCRTWKHTHWTRPVSLWPCFMKYRPWNRSVESEIVEMLTFRPLLQTPSFKTLIIMDHTRSFICPYNFEKPDCKALLKLVPNRGGGSWLGRGWLWRGTWQFNDSMKKNKWLHCGKSSRRQT